MPPRFFGPVFYVIQTMFFSYYPVCIVHENSGYFRLINRYNKQQKIITDITDAQQANICFLLVIPVFNVIQTIFFSYYPVCIVHENSDYFR